MKKSMRKSNKLRYTALAALLTLGISPIASTIHAESSNDYSVNYIESGEEEETLPESGQVRDTAGKTQEEINEAEGIASEQIVVKISEEGYVTSHGDHYHYYNGQVPHNSFISESLLVDEGYQLNEADVVSELEDAGFVVLVDGEYKVYYEDIEAANKLRTIDELVLQSHGIHPKEAADIVALRKEFALDETAMIIYELQKDLETVAKEVEADKNPAVVYLTEKETVYLVGTDLYVMPGEMAKDVKIYDQLIAPSDYDFDAADVVRDVPGGHVVKIEDKNYLYFTDGVPIDRLVTKEDLVAEVKKVSEKLEATGQAKERQAKKAEANAGAVLGAGHRDGSGRLVAEDGYVFSPYDVIRDAGNGFIVPHGNHFHFIPKSQLTPQELEIANRVLGQSGQSAPNQSSQTGQAGQSQAGNNQAQGNQSVNSDKVIKDAPKGNGRYDSDNSYTTDDGYVFTAESIVSADQAGLVTAHHDHFHYVPFSDLNKKELKAAQDYLKKNFGIDRNLVEEFAPSNSEPKPIPQPAPQTDEKPDAGSKTEKDEKSETEKSDSKTEDKLETEKSDSKPEDKSEPETKPDSKQPSQPTEVEKSDLQKALDKLYALPKSERHVEEDGLIFDPMEVTRVIQTGNERGFVIPHGDHWHVIKESQLTEFEREVTNMALVEKGLQAPAPTPETKPEDKSEAEKPEVKPESETESETKSENKAEETEPETESEKTEPESKSETNSETEKSTDPEIKSEEKTEATETEKDDSETNSEIEKPESESKKVDFLALNIEKADKGKDGKPYTTSDGYTFTPESIKSYDEIGIVAEHGDHEHYIPLNELEDSELQAAADYINRTDNNVEVTKEAEGTPEEIDRKLSYVAALVGLPKEKLGLTGNLVIYPHGNHSHTIDLAEIPLKLTADQYSSKEAYRDHLLGLKFNQTRLDYPGSQIIRDGDELMVMGAEGTKYIKLNDVELPFEYEEVDFSEFKRPKPQVTEVERQPEPDSKEEEKVEEPQKQVSVAEMTEFLANHYGIKAERIKYFSKMFIITSESQDPNAENTIIQRDVVEQAMEGDLSGLPTLESTTTETTESEDADQPAESEENEKTDSSEGEVINPTEAESDSSTESVETEPTADESDAELENVSESAEVGE